MTGLILAQAANPMRVTWPDVALLVALMIFTAFVLWLILR
jgi:hypothetical protein